MEPALCSCSPAGGREDSAWRAPCSHGPSTREDASRVQPVGAAALGCRSSPGPGSLWPWPPPSTTGVAFRGQATGLKAAMPSTALACRPVRRMSTQGAHRRARVSSGLNCRAVPAGAADTPSFRVSPVHPSPNHPERGAARPLGPVQASSTAAPRGGSLRVLIALPGHREGRTKSLSVTSLLAVGS